MPRVTFKSVLEGVYQMGGGDPSQFSDADKRAVIQFIADRTRDAWEFYRWPEQMLTEPRNYRLAYDAATTYAIGSEVFYLTAYYTCTAPSTGNLPTDTDYWSPLTTFRKGIPWAQTGQTAIEAVLRVWNQDPDTYESARELDYKLVADGLVLDPGTEEATVWVEFRSGCPDFECALYSATAVYAIGDLVYAENECYLVGATTTAGDLPSTAPAKFTLQSIPYRLARAIKAGAFADYLTNNDQDSKASKWEGKFNYQLEEQVWQLTKLQGQTGRPQVRV